VAPAGSPGQAGDATGARPVTEPAAIWDSISRGDDPTELRTGGPPDGRPAG
jgi:hypothetical protein